MSEVFDRAQIDAALEGLDPIGLIEEGFVAYSRGEVVVPPVGELVFDDPPGDVHIKYGYIRDDDYYVIKVASGFYGEPAPSYSGLMLVFRQRTGALEAVLIDEAHLTNVRTAAAGAVAARHLAPARVERIGILGAGTQGHMQLQALRGIVDCSEVLVWGRHQERLDAYRADLEPEGWSIDTTREAADVGSTCNLIVTATPAQAPLLESAAVRPGTHITAIGSDTPGKIELEPGILGRADRVVADSLSQCRERGEVAHALRAGVLSEEDVVELGDVIAGNAPGRDDDGQLTVADLTGVAVQDIQIAKAVYARLRDGGG